jgi:hypothetical protein
MDAMLTLADLGVDMFLDCSEEAAVMQIRRSAEQSE